MIVGCATSTSRQTAGTMVGMQLGSVIGGAVGHASTRGHDGYFWGTAIGAVAGAAIGNSLNAPQRADDIDDEVYSANESKNIEKGTKNKGAHKPIKRHLPVASSILPVRVSNVVLQTEDGDKLFRGGEYAKLSFDIVNVSDKTIGKIIPSVICDNANIELSAMTAIDNLYQGDGVRYTVSLYADNGLLDGTADAVIAISVDGGEYRVAYKTKFLTKK